MLGDKVYEGRGTVTGRRVVPDAGGPRVETTIQEMGTLLGVDMTETVTYWAELRPDGTLYGEGQGVIMGKGGEAATLKGTGTGKFTGPGSVAFRGAIYIESASPAWSRLNGAAIVFEHDVDAEGRTWGQSWEWK